ncbi:hypothetical protein, partial [Ruminococcus sp.]|uniref:hypothetical protein n=1 Tax=Ruminococcus sp. TaxID=41978 RepID=UPI00257E90B5
DIRHHHISKLYAVQLAKRPICLQPYPKVCLFALAERIQIAIYYFHFSFGIMLQPDYIPKIIKIDQVLHPLFFI